MDVPQDVDLLEFLCQDLLPPSTVEADLPVLTTEQLDEVVSSLGGQEATTSLTDDISEDVLLGQVLGVGGGGEAPDANCLSENAVLHISDVGLPSPASSTVAPSECSSSSSSSSTSDTESGNSRCPVCGREGVGKHVYYGARVCVSCRGFFRRSVQSRQHPLFRCAYAGDCKVDSTARRSCKFCRFKKCLAAGMKTSWVMSDQERRDRVARRCGAGSPSSSPSAATSPGALVALVRNDEVALRMTEDERHQFQAMFDDYMHRSYDKYFSYMRRSEGTFRRFALTFLSALPVDRDFILECEDLDVKALVEYGFDMPEIRSLPAFDRMTLMYENHKLVFSLLCVIFNNMDEMMHDYLRSFLDYGRTKRATDPGIDTMVAEMERLELGQRTNNDPPKVAQTNEEVWDIGLQHVRRDHQQEAKRLIRVMEPIVRGTFGQLDPILMILMMRMLLFRIPGSARNLEDTSRVQSLHEAQAWQLHRYLKTHYKSEANGRLHRLLMLEEPLERLYNVVKVP